MIWRALYTAVYLSLICAPASSAQTNADGSYTIPIYQNPSSLTPSHYTIYASFGNGPLLPYLFDTGAPYLMSFYNNTTNLSTNGAFTFSTGLTYFYNEIDQSVSLGTSAGQTNVTTASPVNLGQVNYTDADIFDPASTTNQVANPTSPQADGTYGDFGAGFYGSSTFATILAQLPLAASLKQGYTLNVTTNSLQGSLTLGLTESSLDALSNAPGAIVMSLLPTGTNIPTATNDIPGYAKTQVADVNISLSKQGVTTNSQIPFVLDTGGGPNAVLYSTNLAGFGDATNLSVSSTNGQQLYTVTDNQTPWEGNVSVITNLAGGERLNSGGYFFQSNIVTFDLSDGVVIIDPVPEPASWAMLVLSLGGALLCLRHRKPSRY